MRARRPAARCRSCPGSARENATCRPSGDTRGEASDPSGGPTVPRTAPERSTQVSWRCPPPPTRYATTPVAEADTLNTPSASATVSPTSAPLATSSRCPTSVPPERIHSNHPEGRYAIGRASLARRSARCKPDRSTPVQRTQVGANFCRVVATYEHEMLPVGQKHRQKIRRRVLAQQGERRRRAAAGGNAGEWSYRARRKQDDALAAPGSDPSAVGWGQGLRLTAVEIQSLQTARP